MHGWVVNAMGKRACPERGHVHCSDDVTAIGRFAAGGPLGYRAADVPGAPLRPTRAEAESDKCAHRSDSAEVARRHDVPLEAS